jgi:hypothetical protein
LIHARFRSLFWSLEFICDLEFGIWILKYPLLYEINTRCWLAELSQRAGRRLTLADVPESEFEFWQRCGFTHLWLMGVWTLGARGRDWSRKCYHGREDEFRCDDIAGSPYAVAGYSVSRKLGGESALAKFRGELNQRGLKLLLDFVPNHTALDHPWVKAHPEFYITSDTRREGTTKPNRSDAKWFAHGASGHDTPWVDTLQLDYRNRDLRRAITDELRAISRRCDGVRCDMAMLVLNEVFARTWREFGPPASATPSPWGADFSPLRPADGETRFADREEQTSTRTEVDAPREQPEGWRATEFWTDAMAAVRAQHRDFVFLAEVYWELEERLQELGFDYTYDKRLYDRIVAHDAQGASAFLAALTPEFVSRSAHFLENHDEPRIASLLSPQEHRAAALLILGLPGMRFLHEGQLAGLKVQAHVHFAKRGVEVPDPHVAAFYERLLGVLPRTATGQGRGELLPAQPAWDNNVTQRNFVLVQWQRTPPAFDLVVVNLSGERSQCYAPLRPSGLTEQNWRLTDLLSEEVHERRGAELATRGLYLDLPAHGAQLFHCEPIP